MPTAKMPPVKPGPGRFVPPARRPVMTPQQASILKSPPGKIDPVLMDRNVAQAHAPKTTQGDIRTDCFTYFTKGDEQTYNLYNGDRLWAKVIVTLETAGPVAIGTRAAITPVLSGKGLLLTTGRATELTIGKGTILYIASSSVNRVSVILEPLPWLEQITGLVANLNIMGH